MTLVLVATWVLLAARATTGAALATGGWEFANRRLGYQLDSEFYGTKFLIDRVQEALPRLKLEDINAAVKRHLQAANLAVAIVTENAAALKETLLSGKPTPITYPRRLCHWMIWPTPCVSPASTANMPASFLCPR